MSKCFWHRLIIFFLLTDDDDEEEGKDKMATSRQTIIEIKVPPKAVGTVIGRQGAMIKEVRVTKKMATSLQTS